MFACNYYNTFNYYYITLMLPASSCVHGWLHIPYCMHNQNLKYSLTHHGLSWHHHKTNASYVHSTWWSSNMCHLPWLRSKFLQCPIPIDFGAQCTSLFTCCYCWHKSQHYSTQLLVRSTVTSRTKQSFTRIHRPINMAIKRHKTLRHQQPRHIQITILTI